MMYVLVPTEEEFKVIHEQQRIEDEAAEKKLLLEKEAAAAKRRALILVCQPQLRHLPQRSRWLLQVLLLMEALPVRQMRLWWMSRWRMWLTMPPLTRTRLNSPAARCYRIKDLSPCNRTYTASTLMVIHSAHVEFAAWLLGVVCGVMCRYTSFIFILWYTRALLRLPAWIYAPRLLDGDLLRSIWVRCRCSLSNASMASS